MKDQERRNKHEKKELAKPEAPSFTETPAADQPATGPSPYARPGSTGTEETGGETVFAAPVRVNAFSAFHEENEKKTSDISWDTASASSKGPYVVMQEEKKPRKKLSGKVIFLLIVLLVIAGICAALWFLAPGTLPIQPEATAAPTEAAPTPTPEPVRSYIPGTADPVSETALGEAEKLLGPIQAENILSTADHIVMRAVSPRSGYDYYVFSANNGRLLGYFESTNDHAVLSCGSALYVPQYPWLMKADGTELIHTANITAMQGGSMKVRPLRRGWSVIESEKDGSLNLISEDAQLLSPLWFSKVWPFTGAHTLAYVDTGSTAGAQRYLLYNISDTGEMTRLDSSEDMSDVLIAAHDLALMKDGSLYSLNAPEEPVASCRMADIYPDCSTWIVRDAESGKFSLYTGGVQQYSGYDAIHPVEGDLEWNSITIKGRGCTAHVYTVEIASAMPVTYYFELKKNDAVEYVALSAAQDTPFLLQDEFGQEAGRQ